MATAGLLPDMMRTRVYEAVLAASMSVDELLSTLPEEIRRSVPPELEPQQRLAKVLLSLNNVRAPEESLPLVVFLQRAARLCGSNRHAAIFREAISLIEDGTTTEQVPENVLVRRPWYLGLVKLLYQKLGFTELPDGASTSPVFVTCQDMRARVVGIAVGDPSRVVTAVQEQVQFMAQAAFRVEGHIVFPEREPSPEEEQRVLDAGLSPRRLQDLQRKAERYVRQKHAPTPSGTTARQTAWRVERCKAAGMMGTLALLRDRTAERLRDLIADLGADRARHVLVRTSRPGLLGIASCALLTAWNEIIDAGSGEWPLHLPLEEPFPIDLDDLLDRALSEQRVTSERAVADSLFSDEDSVPVVCFGEEAALSEAHDILHPILTRKRRCVVLASEAGSRTAGVLFRSRFAFDTILRFPQDFEPPERTSLLPLSDQASEEDSLDGSPCSLWDARDLSDLRAHPDCARLVTLMRRYPSPAHLRTVAQSVGFDVSLVAFHNELERVVNDLVERAFNSDHLRDIVKAMRDDPALRHWRRDASRLLRQAR